MVQRYDYDTKIVDGWKEHRGVFENDKGDYVKYGDYLIIAALNQKLHERYFQFYDLCDELINHLRYNKAESSDKLDLFWSKLDSITTVMIPQECLAQVQAEAGRKSFIAGIAVGRLNPMRDATTIEKSEFDLKASDEHAERIRQEVNDGN